MHEKMMHSGRMVKFADLLNIPIYAAVGLIETLRHMAMWFAPRGDIGRWGDDALRLYTTWDKGTFELIAALVESGWISRNKDGHIILLDWRGAPGSRQAQPGYRDWRIAVLDRDGWQCRDCGAHRTDEGITLHAHHLQDYRNHPELRVELSNGRTLCQHCHHEAHSEGVHHRG